MKSVFAFTAAALVAASFILPGSGALAATHPAKAAPKVTAIVFGKAKTAMPSADLIKALGVYKTADLSALAGARTVTVYHVRAAYPLPVVLKLEHAIGKAKTPIANLQKAVGANKGASAWFSAHKMNVKRLVAVVAAGKTVSIYEN